MIYHDQHVHTNFSGDSTEEMENYIKKAISLKLPYVAFTDHADFLTSWSKKDEILDYNKYINQINYFQGLYPEIKILSGVEMGYQKRDEALINNYLSTNKWDLIILSVHEKGNIDYYYKNFYDTIGIENVVRMYFEQVYEGIRGIKDFDIVGHLDYSFRSLYRNFGKIYPLDPYRDILELIFKELIIKDKSFEINTSVYDTTGSFYYIEYFVKLYLSFGGKNLVVSSDAHKADRFCSSFKEVIAFLKSLGVKELTYYINRKKHFYSLED